MEERSGALIMRTDAPTATVQRRRAIDGRLPALLLFLPPALLLFTLFVVLPIVEAAWYSGFNWNGFGRPTKWIAAAEWKINQRAVVHHINAFVRPKGSSYVSDAPAGEFFVVHRDFTVPAGAQLFSLIGHVVWGQDVVQRVAARGGEDTRPDGPPFQSVSILSVEALPR